MTQNHALVLEAVRRASARAAGTTHVKIGRGVGTLASIAVTAPWVGVVGNLLGIFNSFGSLGTDRWTAYYTTIDRLCQSLIPTEFGVLVGLAAYTGYKYLRARVDTFDHEMWLAAEELVDRLGGMRVA
jgi:biopolymer transport protein ExbB/TolQ